MTLDRESQQEVVFNIVACLVFCLELRSVGRYNPFYLVLVQGGTHVESPSLDIKDQSCEFVVIISLGAKNKIDMAPGKNKSFPE